MSPTFLTILVGVALVVAATFLLKTALSVLFKVAGLAVVALIARREEIGARGWEWIDGSELVTIISAALFGYVVSVVMAAMVFREDGLGRHFGAPLIAVAAAYGAAYFIDL
ncbi:MAG: hypothetical protein V2I43_03895 [Parvularcula sp.]|jgi:hypothetical protein|nr:hypothetical protein [Parvularcula sp.]